MKITYLKLSLLAVLVAGATMIISCEKEETSNSKSTVNTDVTTKIVDSPSVLNFMRDYYSACDNAYRRDSITFLSVCKKNDIETFNKLLGFSDDYLKSMYEVYIETYNVLLEKHPEFYTEESSCSDCVTKALPRLGIALSLTSGNLIETVPTALDYNYGMRLSRCIQNCIDQFGLDFFNCVNSCMLIPYLGDLI